MSDLPHSIAPHARRNDRAGFTLIEICTVVVIIAILAAIALPGLASQNDMSSSAAARIVLADLLYAQGQAIATGQQQFVSFTLASNVPGGGGGSYTLSSPAGSVLMNPATRAAYSRSFGGGSDNGLGGSVLADLTLDSAGNTVLVFDSLGEPLVCPVNGTPVLLANTGSIVLQSGASAVTLSIEPDTGNITVSN